MVSMSMCPNHLINSEDAERGKWPEEAVCHHGDGVFDDTGVF